MEIVKITRSPTATRKTGVPLRVRRVEVVAIAVELTLTRECPRSLLLCKLTLVGVSVAPMSVDLAPVGVDVPWISTTSSSFALYASVGTAAPPERNSQSPYDESFNPPIQPKLDDEAPRKKGKGAHPPRQPTSETRGSEAARSRMDRSPRATH
jgi:hypothetical protein